MSTIKFECKSCGCNQLEEVMTGVTVISPISIIFDGDGLGDCEYETSINKGGEVSHFQCNNCGEVVDGATDLVKLVEILKARE